MNPDQKKIISELATAAIRATLAIDLLQELLILLVEKRLVEKRDIKKIHERLINPPKI